MTRRDESIHARYLRDVGLLIKERSREAKRDRAAARSEFEDGRLIGYYEVISLLRSEAQTFGLPLEDLQLHDVDPDQELIELRLHR